MFVLQSFVRKNNTRLNIFKTETRAIFRSEFISHLDRTYEFSILIPRGDFKEAIDRNFKLLLGISLCLNEEKDELIVAFEKNEKGGMLNHRGKSYTEVKGELEQTWEIDSIKLSEYERKNN